MWINVTMTYVQVGSSEEQEDFWLGEAPPVLNWGMGGDARQRGRQQWAAHEPWVQAVSSLVPVSDTVQAQAIVDRNWLCRHRVLRRWRHGVWPVHSCRKAGGGRTDLGQSGKPIALFLYVKLHNNTLLSVQKYYYWELCCKAIHSNSQLKRLSVFGRESMTTTYLAS